MSELEAGRELDARVAEKVMGFSKEQRLTLGEYHGIKDVLYLEPGCAAYRRKSEHDGYWENWSPTGAEVIVSDCVPPYSTDIAAAMELLLSEFAKQDGAYGWEFELGYEMTTNKFSCWLNNGGCSWEMYAPTLPHAICLAALKAVGHE